MTDPERGIEYCAWKAKWLNELFNTYGVSKQTSSKIKPETVRHGLNNELPYSQNTFK